MQDNLQPENPISDQPKIDFTPYTERTIFAPLTNNPSPKIQQKKVEDLLPEQIAAIVAEEAKEKPLDLKGTNAQGVEEKEYGNIEVIEGVEIDLKATLKNLKRKADEISEGGEKHLRAIKTSEENVAVKEKEFQEAEKGSLAQEEKKSELRRANWELEDNKELYDIFINRVREQAKEIWSKDPAQADVSVSAVNITKSLEENNAQEENSKSLQSRVTDEKEGQMVTSPQPLIENLEPIEQEKPETPSYGAGSRFTSVTSLHTPSTPNTNNTEETQAPQEQNQQVAEDGSKDTQEKNTTTEQDAKVDDEPKVKDEPKEATIPTEPKSDKEDVPEEKEEPKIDTSPVGAPDDLFKMRQAAGIHDIKTATIDQLAEYRQKVINMPEETEEQKRAKQLELQAIEERRQGLFASNGIMNIPVRINNLEPGKRIKAYIDPEDINTVIVETEGLTPEELNLYMKSIQSDIEKAVGAPKTLDVRRKPVGDESLKITEANFGKLQENKQASADIAKILNVPNSSDIKIYIQLAEGGQRIMNIVVPDQLANLQSIQGREAQFGVQVIRIVKQSKVDETVSRRTVQLSEIEILNAKENVKQIELKAKKIDLGVSSDNLILGGINFEVFEKNPGDILVVAPRPLTARQRDAITTLLKERNEYREYKLEYKSYLDYRQPKPFNKT